MAEELPSKHQILPGMIMPSNDAAATRLAIAYDLVRRFGRPEESPTAVAALVGEVARILAKAERS